ncbi:AAA family ATPase [Asaia bogorensis]|uniref:AAA family ATPase n=1 Tax=Asaia bogorensis TaxID=91915 RepID=UPI000EFCC2E1|nr:AAA family ATPase [Asaia bogorensis]
MKLTGRLGSRICIIGPSNSGKSTLALRIGTAYGLSVVHLDLLRYHYGDFSTLRPLDVFHADHARAVSGESWVIEGNYSSCMEDRLARATGLILLDASTCLSLYRYLRRCARPGQRIGGFARDTCEPISVAMLGHIVGPTRMNRRRYRTIYARSRLPKCSLPTPRAVDEFCRHVGL